MAYVEKRITKSGEIRYRALIRLKGSPPQSATFERKTDAKRWVQKTEAAIRDGRHFTRSEAKIHTGAELIDRYIAEILPRKPKSIQTQRSQLLWWRGQLTSHILADVNAHTIAGCRSKLCSETVRGGGTRSTSTINRYMAAISHVFSVAVREWGWLESNPVGQLGKLKEPSGRVRFLSDDERARLLKACKESSSAYLYAVVVIALSTGMRKGEVLGLRWKNINLDRCVITLEDTKNQERRAIPLAGLALDIVRDLAEARNSDCDLLFPGRSAKSPVDIRTPWETALLRADVADFRFHDLRHSTASYLAMNGASMAEIAEVLGHKSLEMVKRYTHLSDQHTASVVASMNKKIFG